jgi:hypothetical protein
VVPFGYHVLHAGPLTRGGPREQPLTMIGSPARHTRRARIVEGMARAAGPELRITHAAWGDDRSRLLRGTKVVLDVHRVPGNFVGIRLLLALAAGAAVVTEPMTDPWPFVPGVHHVEAPLEGLLDAARALAADDPRRDAMVAAGQELLSTRLTMASSVAAVVDVLAGPAPALDEPPPALDEPPPALDDRR